MTTLRAQHRAVRIVILLVVPAVSAGAIGCGEPDPRMSGRDMRGERDTVMIDATVPACAACRLRVLGNVKLGDPTDAKIPERVPNVVRDSRGSYYLTFHGWSRKPILRYDSTGRYLGVLGGYGRGPGEYRMTSNVFIGPGDSVYVAAEGRLQLYAPGGEYVRNIAAFRGTPVGVAPDGSGTIYAEGRPRQLTRTHDNWLLRLGPTGAVQDSFPVFSPDGMERAHPVVGPDGSLWTYMRKNYRLERHGRDGAVAQLIGVVPDARAERPFLTRAEGDSAARAEDEAWRARRPVKAARVAPDGMIRAMVDSTGLVWVVRTIPAPRWDTVRTTPEHLSPDEAPHEVTLPREQEDRLYNTVVEIIDPTRAVLLARTQLAFLGLPVAPGWVARVTADTAGYYHTWVYRLALDGHDRGGGE